MISFANLTEYDDIVCEFALCTFTFNLLDRVVNFSWLFIWIWSSLCATREITVFAIVQQHMKYTHSQNMKHTLSQQHMKYTLSRTKRKGIIIKRHFCLSFSRLYLFIRSCKLVIIETCTFDITHDESAMSSLIIQSI